MKMWRFRKSISEKSTSEPLSRILFWTLRIDLSYRNVYNYDIIVAFMHEADEKKG